MGGGATIALIIFHLFLWLSTNIFSCCPDIPSAVPSPVHIFRRATDLMIKKYFFRGKIALGHEGKVSFVTRYKKKGTISFLLWF